MIGSKKGVEFGGAVVIGLILLAAAAVALAFLLPVVTNLIKGQGSSAACIVELSFGKGAESCPIEDAEIFDNRLEIEDKVVLEKRSEGEDFPKEALTRLLRNCLGRGGGVNSRAFSRDDWFGTTEVCLECYHLTIEDENIVYTIIETGVEKKIPGIKDFTGYLSGNGPKGILDEKYIDILTKDDTHKKAYMQYGQARVLSPSRGDFIFTPDKEYTVFFVGLKEGSFNNIWGKVKAGFEGNFLKAALGTSDVYFAYISESGNLKNACQRKVN